ncbi:hypothetical protein C3E98_023945 [Pseudomonas sp. MWU13-2625]|nr:hypothetical protein C3E98_023945 [Pseudomonas sp. MWU13-2625]
MPQSTTKHTSPVGVSLLAIAQCQSASMLNTKPLSRAGSLPQGQMSGRVFCIRRAASCKPRPPGTHWQSPPATSAPEPGRRVCGR